MLTRCPECDGKIRVDDADLDARITCPHCDAEFRLPRKGGGNASPPAKAYCPFCGHKFKASKPPGTQVVCPGCKCKFKLPNSTAGTAPADKGDGPAPPRNHGPLMGAFMKDVNRSVDEKRRWRKWNETARRRAVIASIVAGLITIVAIIYGFCAGFTWRALDRAVDQRKR
jgi:uncharacterized Zn-finger protein